jgi:hypothetical protein
VEIDEMYRALVGLAAKKDGISRTTGEVIEHNPD